MVDIHHPLFERGGAKAGWKFGQLKKLREKELRKAIKSSLDYKDKSDVDRLMQWATFGILPTLIAFEIEPKYPVLVDGFNRYYLANGMGWKKIPVSVFRYLGEEENES